jgi:hypothetical protein
MVERGALSRDWITGGAALHMYSSRMAAMDKKHTEAGGVWLPDSVDQRPKSQRAPEFQ